VSRHQISNDQWIALTETSAAQDKLAKAVADGRVQAWGRPIPHGLIEEIPPDPFRIPGVQVVVGVHGEMKTALPQINYKGPRWSSIEFEANEIEKAWPKPPPPPVAEWMRKEAERVFLATGRPAKRDSMIRGCMDATGCQKRDAESVHKILPGEHRRRRGKS